MLGKQGVVRSYQGHQGRRRRPKEEAEGEGRRRRQKEEAEEHA